MAPLLVATHSVDANPVGVQACSVESLSALGPLLCLHAPPDSHLLNGWRRARSLLAHIRLDSDGPHEALHFFDADGFDCWRLCLLPDSDFLAWERLLATLPVHVDSVVAGRRIWGNKRTAQPHWQACALRLHAVSDPEGSPQLATADVVLSVLGRRCAQRIADRSNQSEARARSGWARPAWAR